MASTDVPTTVYGNSHSLSFDGDDHIAVADSPELNPSAVTVSAWVKLSNLTGIQTVAAKWDVGALQQYVLQVQDDDVYFYVGDGANIDSDSVVAADALTADTWYHLAGSYDGTNLVVYVDGVATADTSAVVLGSSSEPFTAGAKEVGGVMGEYLTGQIDDVRVYSRALGAGEITDLAAGNHTSAAWDGSDSVDYDTAANWDINAVPDPYTNVTIAPAVNQPVASADIGLASLAIVSEARFNLDGWNLSINDGGSFSNDGTLQIKNSETLSGFTNDTDSGTVLITPDANIAGLKSGDSYYNLIMNDGTFAHWPFDDDADSTPEDVSGMGHTLAPGGAPAYDPSVAPTNFANDNSASFDGSDDHYSFAPVDIPENATWCAWVNQDAGSGTILGTTGDQYALRINGGNQVAIKNGDTILWSISSIYGSWHHICVSQTDSGLGLFYMELYVDGNKVGSTENLDEGGGEIRYIGRDDANFFDGRLDDVRIYDRALLPTEIALLASGEQPDTYTSTQSLAGNLDVNGDLTLASGRLDATASNYSIALGGSLYGDGGVLDMREGAVVLDGGDQEITSSHTFYDLTKTVTSAATLTFGQGSTTVVGNQLTLSGASGQVLSLRSSTPGNQWRLDPAGTYSLEYLDVQDSNNLDEEVIDITDSTITDSGNNTGWTVNVAPDDPANLGPANYVDGSFDADTTPTLTFDLTDDNAGDQLRFSVQVDDDSDFSSPLLDYASDLSGQGSRSFTVGQSGGSYTTGSEGMSLPSGDYYWRVKAIDDYSTVHESGYAVANGGAIAFRVDADGPDAPGVPTSVSDPTETKPIWTWSASSDSGVGLGDPAYELEWSKDNTFNTGVSSTTTNDPTFTHETDLTDGGWYLRVRSVDALGNPSTWAVSASHLVDTTGPTTPTAPFTSSPTSITRPAWTWSPSSDSGSGLHPTEPYVLEWSQTSNFSSGVFSTTRALTNFTHSTDLADGTWYMRVKAVDALGNESAWSANGQVLIDGTAPDIPGTPSTDSPTADNTPTWTWASSTDAGSGLSPTPYTVQWANNASFAPAAGSTTSSITEYTHGTSLADGTWYFRVSARDNLGNQSGYSTVGSVVIDTTGPSVPSTPATATPTNDTTPVWSWGASNDGSGVGLSAMPYTVEWSQDSEFNTVDGSDTTAATDFTHGSELTEGTWYFRVKAADSLGNESAWSTPGEVILDVTDPSTPGTPMTTTPTNNTQPYWAWAASSDSGGAGLADPAYIVEWSDDDFDTVEGSATSNTANYTHTSNLADGTWYFRVRAADAAGNQSAWSSTSQVMIDTVPPSVPGAPTTSTPTGDTTPAWSWAGSTDEGGLAVTPYTIQWSTVSNFASVSGSSSIADPDFTHSTPLAHGTWYVRVKATDSLGNQSAWSDTGAVFIDSTPPDTPVTPVTTTPTTDTTPTWTWEVPDDTGVGLDDTPYTVEWSTDSGFGTITDSTTTADPTFTHSTPLADDTWYFRVSATDAVGNTSDWSEAGEVLVDTTAPSAPGTPLTSDPLGDNTPTWTWAASGDGAGSGLDDPAYTVEWSQDSGFGSGVSSDTTDTASYTHTETLADGTWYIRVRASDVVGNESPWSTSGTKVVDVSAPSVPGAPSTDSPTADNTPTWTWAASDDGSGTGLDETPYLIEWSQDADFLISVESDTITDPTFTHSTPLADGTWYFRVRSQDNAGNISAYSATGTVFIDVLAPTTPGTPATASPTTDNTPTWTWDPSTDSGVGLDDPAYTVEWSQDSEFNTVDGSDAANAASYTHVDPLADGTWYFRVRASDAVGNESENSAVASVVTDDTPPSVPGMPATDNPTADTTPTWTWSDSTDNVIGLRESSAYEVQWSLDDTFASGVSSGTADTASFTHSTELDDNTWYFRVRAVDRLDNTSAWSPAGEVVIATAGPTTPGQPATSAPTTDTTPTWTWTASVAVTGLGNPAYYLEWSQDNTFMSNVFSDTAVSNTFTHTDPLADGVWYIRLRAVDNTTLFSAYSVLGSALVDTTSPSVPGAPDTTTPGADNTPTWTWDPSTDSGVGLGATPYTLEWSQNGDFSSGVSSSTAVDPTFTHSTPLADGTWYMRVRASDDLNNVSAWSSVASVVVDATAPTVPGAPSTTSPTNDQTPTWTWDPSTDSGVGFDDPAYEVQWSQDGSFTGGTTTDTTNSSNFTHTGSLTDGTWYFRVRASDAVGNESGWSSAGFVIVDGSVPTTPGQPSAGSASTNDQTPTWTWDPSTDSGVGLDDPAYEVQWSQTNDFSSGVSSANTGTADFTHGSELAAGTWYFRVRAADVVGNQSGWSGNGEVYIDTDTPTSPGTPSPAVSPTSDNTPTWTWDPSTDSGFGFGDTPYEVQWSQDANFVDDVTNASAAAEDFTHAESLADGTWYFRVRAVDEAGNQSAWSAHGTVVVDASAPTGLADLQVETPTTDTTPDWTWAAASDSGVGLDDPAYEVQWSQASSFAGAVSITTNDPGLDDGSYGAALADGTWYFRVRASDNLGNRTDWLTSSVTVDTQPPVISGMHAIALRDGAAITWTTNEPSSSRVEYGAGSFDDSTAETDTSPRVTSHAVSLSGLPSCGTFRYRVISSDSLGHETISAAGSFTTTTCSGNAAVMAGTRQSVGSGGGQLSLSSGSANLALQIPAGVTGGTLDFQAKQLSPAPALSQIGLPARHTLVGSHVYDLKAVNSDNVLVTSFGGALSITISYTAGEAAGFVPGSLAIFRHDGTAWQELACSINDVSRTVACTTTGFSVFGLFGTRVTPAPALPEGDGTVDPDPEVPVPTTPDTEEPEDEGGQAEAASDERGLGSAFTRVVRTVVRRPVWWISALLLAVAAALLIIIKRRRGNGKHVPYGIHRDEK